MDGRAAIAALIGVAIGTAVAVCVGERRWWGATAIGALGTAFALGIVPEGNHSRVEHNVVFAVMLLLIACSGGAMTAAMRARRRDNP